MAHNIDELLAEQGLRSTGPRRAVWQVLSNAAEHLTAEQVTERVHEVDGSVNLASVYRSLALFRDLKLVRESRLGEDATYWELAHPDEHFHMVCDSCGSVAHHVGALVDQIADHLRSGHGFETASLELVVHGECGACSGRLPADHAHDDEGAHSHSHPHVH